MDKRFFKMFGLTEEEAIAIIDTPLEQLEDASDKYIAVSHLINFPTEQSIAALVRAIETSNPNELDHRIVRRKAVESLGRLQAQSALPVIRQCLKDDDIYTIENSVWAIGEIGTKDPEILEEVAQLLDKPGQIYRVIIHTLANADYQPSLERVLNFTQVEDEPTRSAAIATVCRFTGDYSQITEVMALLQSPSVNARRGCIQDLIDSHYYKAIPEIARCPVSLVFRLRALRMLLDVGVPSGEITFTEIQPYLEQVLYDRPNDLDLVHEYDATPVLDFVINELYETDFGRCYLATKTLLDIYAQEAPAALLATYSDKAYNDYGAHYHVMKLFGWLKYAPAYDLLVENLHNREPQFQKSRAACAIALGELGDSRAIPEIKICLNTPIWDLKYACLLALERLGDSSGREICAHDADWLIRAKATSTQ
ncbi:HEAT repeat domain-containing protein [Nostoc sp. 'Lobaria pulmonaria (5183) cyanobiont']|uniref:HEAT repeat domain-containing protein n=1 Tax=Nostoc sp. 'Lobaria pulmonaria (5183) cyanobiont' TaxID=1618022 RepID=UPI000CF31D46|nr:HEAT repeat domain-containing protein [Nostoc sp. 'Lobaria pulmonaria (5183) cyanobiont']AVH72050.1 bilin biosynthesis protein CpeY [Nostoc sp. 'Lobaria pulmonaria (5183) cyanobiont']